MGVKFFISGWFVWAIMVVVNSIFQQAMTGISDMNTVLSLGVIRWTEIANIPIPVPNFGWFQSVYALISWDFFFLSGVLNFVRILGFLWLMAGFAWGFWTTFLPVLLRLVEASASFIRALNPLNFI
jgi:hypothetical protein